MLTYGAMETKTVRFELLMTPTAREALKKLAKKHKVSSGQMVENLVKQSAKRQKLWNGA